MMVTKLGYQHILVATDFSAASVSSLKLPVWLSRQFGSNLVLADPLYMLEIYIEAIFHEQHCGQGPQNDPSVIVRYTKNYSQLANTSILGTRFALTD